MLNSEMRVVRLCIDCSGLLVPIPIQPVRSLSKEVKNSGLLIVLSWTLIPFPFELVGVTHHYTAPSGATFRKENLNEQTTLCR